MMKPLEDIRVVDFTHVVAGPFCTMLLADLGAEVIKIEKPITGDAARNLPTLGPSLFLALNRNKKSLSVNLRTEEGKEIIYKIIKKADVFVESFEPGVVEKYRLDYETLKKRRGLCVEPYDYLATQMAVSYTHLTLPTTERV